MAGKVGLGGGGGGPARGEGVELWLARGGSLPHEPTHGRTWRRFAGSSTRWLGRRLSQFGGVGGEGCSDCGFLLLAQLWNRQQGGVLRRVHSDCTMGRGGGGGGGE